MSGRELDFIGEAFEQNWVAPLGPNVDGFENDLCTYTGVEAAAVLNSGTAALHLALIALGVKSGDIVICQSLTFGATAFPIKYLGAVPVFVDSEPNTWNMDPALLEEAIISFKGKGKSVAAIIMVHLYGMPAKMKEILELAQRYDIPVIEDAAEALGASYQGRACGSLGTIGILSFNGNKIITTSGGGALLSNDKALVARTRFLSTQAKDPFPWYQHSEIGYNYRMSNIAAGIGRGQMTVIDERVRRRRAIHDHYKEQLGALPGFSFLTEPSGHYSNRWLTTVLIDETMTAVNPEGLRLLLERENIESRPLWKPLHAQPVFADAPAFLNGTADRLFARGICLPSGTALTEGQLDHICSLIKNKAHAK